MPSASARERSRAASMAARNAARTLWILELAQRGGGGAAG